MTSYSITIPGDPIPQKRHRDCIGNRFHKYDPSAKEKKEFAKKLITSGATKFLCPLFIDVIFASSIKPSIRESERNSRLWGVVNDSHVDVDNLCKFMLDACNGILWDDDSQVICLSACKVYSEKPFTKMIIMPKIKPKFENNTSVLCHLSPTEYQGLIDDCIELSKVNLEESMQGMEGSQQSKLSSSADTLMSFIGKNFKLFSKLHKQISKLSKDDKNVPKN